MFKMHDINLKKNGSILLYLSILGPFTLILCLVIVLHRFKDKKRSLCHLYYYYIRQNNNCLRFVVNRLIIKFVLINNY